MLRDKINMPISSSLKFNSNTFNYNGNVVGVHFVLGLAKQFNKHWSATIEKKLCGDILMYTHNTSKQKYDGQTLIENKNEIFYARQFDFNYSPLLQNISLHYHF